MNDEIKNASAGAPPKLILRRPAAGPSSDVPVSDSPTVRDTRPPTAKKQTTRIDLSAVEAPSALSKAKKQTSRIPLDAATIAPPEIPPAPAGILESAPSDENALRTIRIKRPAQAQAPKLSQPIEVLLNRQSPSLSDVERISLKKQTSRISLEAALTPDETTSTPIAEGVPSAPSGSPSTIKIKRPGKTAPEAPPAEDSLSPAVPMSEQPTLNKNQTSKIDIAPSSVPATESEGQPTQRKTIKIRRPDGSSPAPTIQRAGGAGRAPVRISKAAGTGIGGDMGGDLSLPAPTEETVALAPLSPRQKILRLVGNIVFSAVASFAVIVSGIVIYILSLQKYDW